MFANFRIIWIQSCRPGNPRPAAIGTPIPGPGPGRIGKRGFPVSRFRVPAKSGIGPGTGIGDLGRELAHGACHEPLAAAADVRWRPEISIFEHQRQHLAPGSCLALTWDEYPRFPDFRPNRDSSHGRALALPGPLILIAQAAPPRRGVVYGTTDRGGKARPSYR